MREMIYRHMNSHDRRKKDLTLAEIHEDDGVTTQLEKRYTYCVKPAELLDRSQAVPILGIQAPALWDFRGNPTRPRHIFVRKISNSRDGIEEFTYKIVGSFYAVQGERTLCITYRHILHMAVSDRETNE